MTFARLFLITCLAWSIALGMISNMNEMILKEQATELNAMVYWGRQEKVQGILEATDDIGALLTFDRILRAPIETALHQKHYDLAAYLLEMMRKYVTYDSIDELFFRVDESILFKMIERRDLRAVKFIVEACEAEGVDICGTVKCRSGMRPRVYAKTMVKDCPEIITYFEEKDPAVLPAINDLQATTSGSSPRLSPRKSPRRSPRSEDSDSSPSVSRSNSAERQSSDGLGRKRKLSGLSIRLRSSSLSPRSNGSPRGSVPLGANKSFDETCSITTPQSTEPPTVEVTPSVQRTNSSSGSGRKLKLSRK